MVRDITGVVGVIASVVGAATDGVEEVIGVDQIYVSSMAVVVKLLKPVVQVIWLTVNMKSSSTTAKSGMMTISSSGKLYVHHPLSSTPLSIKYGRQST